ncbi:hypothetical protein ACFQ9X_26135 [Catenulispora yoronensis]
MTSTSCHPRFGARWMVGIGTAPGTATTGSCTSPGTASAVPTGVSPGTATSRARSASSASTAPTSRPRWSACRVAVARTVPDRSTTHAAR